MKISDHIKNALDACDLKEFDKAMLFACLAVDGTSKKLYPEIKTNKDRFTKFISDHLDIIELMFGGFNLHETTFPIKNKKGNIGLKFQDIVYEKIRCSLAHGNEIPDGFGITIKISEGKQQFYIDLINHTMTFPESVIYALCLPCVLSPVNTNQKINDNKYYLNDPINHYVIDRWWGKIDCARSIMDFQITKIKIDFDRYNDKIK